MLSMVSGHSTNVNSPVPLKDRTNGWTLILKDSVVFNRRAWESSALVMK